MAALIGRGRTGRGQHIDASLSDCQVATLANIASSVLISGQKDSGRWGTAHPSIVPYKAFKTSDGDILIGGGNDRLFGVLCEKLGQPQWAQDERFTTNPLRVKHRNMLESMIEEITKLKTTKEWLTILEGSGMPYAPINDVKSTLENEHVRAREMVVEVEHPTCGPMKLINTPVKYSESTPGVRTPPPTLGQHSDEILKHILGLMPTSRASPQPPPQSKRANHGTSPPPAHIQNAIDNWMDKVIKQALKQVPRDPPQPESSEEDEDEPIYRWIEGPAQKEKPVPHETGLQLSASTEEIVKRVGKNPPALDWAREAVLRDMVTTQKVPSILPPVRGNKEWFCVACMRSKESSPTKDQDAFVSEVEEHPHAESPTVPKLVSGQTLSYEEKSAYFSSLPNSTLVSFLLLACDRHPDLPVFDLREQTSVPKGVVQTQSLIQSTQPEEPAPQPKGNTIAPNLPSVTEQSKRTVAGLPHPVQITDTTKIQYMPPNKSKRKDVADTQAGAEVDELSDNGYESDPPAHFPKPGNGLQLPPIDNLEMVLDDNFEVFSHIYLKKSGT
ncbi:MAG: hypothetical protein Q9157_004209 [Trypethelium eluteriae]